MWISENKWFQRLLTFSDEIKLHFFMSANLILWSSNYSIRSMKFVTRDTLRENWEIEASLRIGYRGKLKVLLYVMRLEFAQQKVNVCFWRKLKMWMGFRYDSFRHLLFFSMEISVMFPNLNGSVYLKDYVKKCRGHSSIWWEQLVEFNAEVNQQNKYGRTPLYTNIIY